MTDRPQPMMARDAGDICHVCGGLVTWTDHLPPLRSGETVRCRTNVRSIRSGSAADAMLAELLGPGTRLVDGQVLYSAGWLDDV